MHNFENNIFTMILLWTLVLPQEMARTFLLAEKMFLTPGPAEIEVMTLLYYHAISFSYVCGVYIPIYWYTIIILKYNSLSFVCAARRKISNFFCYIYIMCFYLLIIYILVYVVYIRVYMRIGNYHLFFFVDGPRTMVITIFRVPSTKSRLPSFCALLLCISAALLLSCWKLLRILFLFFLCFCRGSSTQDGKFTMLRIHSIIINIPSYCDWFSSMHMNTHHRTILYKLIQFSTHYFWL